MGCLSFNDFNFTYLNTVPRGRFERVLRRDDNRGDGVWAIATDFNERANQP